MIPHDYKKRKVIDRGRVDVLDVGNVAHTYPFWTLVIVILWH